MNITSHKKNTIKMLLLVHSRFKPIWRMRDAKLHQSIHSFFY